MYNFTTAEKLLEICEEHDFSIDEVLLRRELNRDPLATREKILAELDRRLNVLRDGINEGLHREDKSVGLMVGGIAKKLISRFKNPEFHFFHSKVTTKAMIYAIATNENNACMGKILAFPTAGAAGVTPGVLIAAQEEYGYKDDEMLSAMLTASAIGLIIAENATLAGAGGGCQAEIGSAAAMAAAALTQLRGGTPEQCVTAATLALKNTLGLVCDPIGGMVEVPCVKRNGIFSTMAISASDLAMAGIESFVPFDQVVDAAKRIGDAMPEAHKETAMGGLATTKVGLEQTKKLGIKITGV